MPNMIDTLDVAKQVFEDFNLPDGASVDGRHGDTVRILYVFLEDAPEDMLDRVEACIPEQPLKTSAYEESLTAVRTFISDDYQYPVVIEAQQSYETRDLFIQYGVEGRSKRHG